MKLVLKQDKRPQIKPPPTKQQGSSDERRYSSKTQHLERDKLKKTELADLHERVKSASLVRDLKHAPTIYWRKMLNYVSPQKLDSVFHHDNRYYSFESSEVWIFPND